MKDWGFGGHSPNKRSEGDIRSREADDPHRSDWDEYTDFSVADWRHDVNDDNTRLGYYAWVDHQRLQATEARLHVCQNCGKEMECPKFWDDVWSIPKLSERVAPGERLPSGESACCGALTHLKEVEDE